MEISNSNSQEQIFQPVERKDFDTGLSYHFNLGQAQEGGRQHSQCLLEGLGLPERPMSKHQKKSRRMAKMGEVLPAKRWMGSKEYS